MREPSYWLLEYQAIESRKKYFYSSSICSILPIPIISITFTTELHINFYTSSNMNTEEMIESKH